MPLILLVRTPLYDTILNAWAIKSPHSFVWTRPGKDRVRDGAGGYTVGAPTTLGVPVGSLGTPTGPTGIRDEDKPGAATKRVRFVTFRNEQGQAPDVQPDDVLTQIDDGTVWTVDSVLTFRRTRQVNVFTMVVRKP